ncbi:MAG: hydrogenase maturation protease [Dactylosporangium sp.]|nr:hydrogenase maturation protease [Dactylosporangium sp.]NNJ62304.1 hydrogenase maturation protease [Dactylosporangium sp.]
MTEPTSTPRRPLVIGYGNSLRRDDGVGWHVAQALAVDPRAADLEVLAAHQLTPELAEDLHRATVAVLVDATPDAPPGSWQVLRLSPAAQSPGGASSHACTPQTLIALARQLYGGAPPVALVAVGTACFDDGDTLTPAVAAAVGPIVDHVLELAAEGW